ncbi:MAG: hypothetical protein H6911_02790 [Rickettsiaceae bacterium]|jgi:hypothetical protein|nr:hypothetical protein [Rickettsiales bacterium]MCP5362875.1 hypothetical protein [Rickettsiaceae bacterium]WPX99004.1 hypothetical protein Megpolyxen_00866 [Candidatus Megaera polyxenophila]
MKITVNKLYGFIAKLVSLLEDELDEIESHKSKNALNIKKNITDTLNKLVVLIIQLNKLSKEEMDEAYTINKEDQAIIKRFVEKYNLQNKT